MPQFFITLARGKPSALPLATWACLTVLGIAFAGLVSSFYPYSDDWSLLPYTLGDKHITWSWLWAQHNEHRLPFVKLVHVGILRGTGGLYPCVVAFNVMLVSSAAALLLSAVRRQRGSLKSSDALIPAILLSPLLPFWQWSFYTQFSAVLLGVCMLMSSRWLDAPDGLRHGDWILTVAAYALLLTNGLPGVVFLSLFSCALLFRAAQTHSGLRRLAVLTAASWCIAALHFYKTTYALSGHHGSSVGTVIPAWLHSIAVGISPIFSASSSYVVIIPIAIFGFATMTGFRGLDPKISQGLAMVIMACGVVSLAISVGRSGSGWQTGIAVHYSMLVAPIGVAAAIGWTTTQNQRAQQAIRIFTVIAISGFFAGVLGAISWGLQTQREQGSVRSEIRSGTPRFEIAKRHIDFFYFEDTPERVSTVTEGLRYFQADVSARER